jgi:FkbH-like protein
MATHRNGTRSLTIASSFVAEPLLPTLSYWFRRHQLDVRVRFAPYGQVLEQLALEGSVLRDEEVDLGVLLVRPEDHLRGGEGRLDLAAGNVERAAAAVEELCGALLRHHEEAASPLLLAIMPANPVADAEAGGLLSAWRQQLRRATSAPGVSALDVEDALDLYRVREVGDPHRDALAHVPYSEECFAAVATAIARQARARWGRPCKVIALDCDYTLWGGACSEDGLDGLDSSGPYEHLRILMRAQAAAGRLLCLVSRNRQEDVDEAFLRHAAPLTPRDVVARRCGWGDKSSSLRSISEELGLGLDAFAFVDDDPVECALVRAQLPEVTVIELPPAPERIPETLRHAWALDSPPLTEADRQRAGSYAAMRRLRTERERAADAAAFIEGLRVEVSVSEAEPAELARIAQLFHRTNQFNATGERFTESRLRQLLQGEARTVWAVRVHDRLGDYGLVGALITSRSHGALRIEQAALSCRVLQRRVEHEMVAAIGAEAAKGGDRLLMSYRDSGRNVPVRRLLEELTGGRLDEREERQWLEIPVPAVAT